MTDVNSALLKLTDKYHPQLVETGTYVAPLMKLLPIVLASNIKESWVADGYDGSNAESEWHTEGADVSTYSADSQEVASLDFKEIRSNKLITGLSMGQALVAISPTDSNDQLLFRIKEGIKHCTKQIGISSYTGAGANDIVGVQTAIDTSLQYAGVSRASFLGWRSVEVDGNGADLSLAMLRELIGALSERMEGKKPDFITCNYRDLNKVKEIADGKTQIVYVGSQAPSVNFGFPEVSFEGVRFVEDPWCPEGEMYAFDRSNAYYSYLPVSNNPASGYHMVRGGSDSPLLPFVFNPLGKTGDAVKFSIQAKVCLVIRAPHRHGKLVNFT